MSNRCGRQIESRGQVRGSGQNYININFNFNGKDKPNTFQGKKIDNFIEIHSDPKSHPSRPNVSMQTLKQKKKKSNAKQQIQINPDLGRKKSKSRLNQAFTPQKKMQDRGNGDSRSITKKSTTKRNSKSTQNLKYFHRKKTPQSHSKSRSNSNQKFYSKSKSRSKSKSSKKLLKNSSKSKIGVVNRPKTASNSTVAVKATEQKSIKTKRSSTKKLQSENQSGFHTHSNAFKKKNSPQKATRKKLSHDESRKNIKSNGNQKLKRKSKQKDRKQLERNPLVHQQQPDFDEESSYKKINIQAHRLIYQDALISEKKKTQKKDLLKMMQNSEKKKSKRGGLVFKYKNGTITESQLIKLEQAVIIIQKYWRGYKARTKLNNQINLAHYKIQMTKKKIADLDPKLWDDGKSNSIIQGDDVESSLVEQDPDLHSEIDRPMSESIASSKQKMATNRVIEYKCSQDILDKLNQLQQEMKEQRNKYSRLEQQNKDLKISLQKVSAHQSFQSGAGVASGLQSMQSSIKSNMSGWQQIKIRPQQQQSESEIQNNSSQNFQLRLPKKIQSNIINKKQKNYKQKKERSLQQNNSIESSNNSYNTLEKYKGKVESLDCSSPKFNPNVNLDTALVQLFKKKEEHIKDKFQKKSSQFERLLKDSIYSPRTYNFKKCQLEQAFKRQTDVIRNKLQEVTKAVSYAKEIDEMPIPSVEHKKQIEPIKQIKQQSQQKVIHVVEDYGNVDLNSHRSKDGRQNFSLEQFNNEKQPQRDRQKEERQKQKQQQMKASIEATNNKAIVIFNQIQQYNRSSDEDEDEQINQIEGQSGKQQEQMEQQGNQIIQNRGFETTLLFIKEYCVNLFEFLRGSSEFRHPFMQGVCEPIQYDMIEFLKAYRTTVENDNDNSYNSQLKDFLYPYFKFLFPKTQVISREAFLEFNSNYQKLKGECEFSVERDYFVNSLLDAFNQSFDYERPCSYYGLPPPWIAESRTLKNHPLCLQLKKPDEKFIQIIESQRFQQACGSAIARVIQWSTSLCGFIPQSPDIGDVVIDEQQINHIRETRMALMLQRDLLDNQQQMLDSVIQQSEVKLHLSKVITEHLIEQLLKQANFFK